MKILVTNDDSYTSESVHYLAQYFTSLGHEVTLIVPMKEQSGISMSVNVNRPLEYEKKDDYYYIINSTPADCVRFGFYGLHRDFDLVVSGINHGLNIGDDIYYSGTCGAIFEAGRMGVKGLALSTNMKTFQDSYDKLPLVLNYFKEHNLFNFCLIWNVNIPVEGHDHIVLTRFGNKHYETNFERDGNIMYQRRQKFPEREEASDTDVYELEHNRNITVSPLSLTRIDDKLVAILKGQK